MWRLRRALSWRASRGTEHAGRAGSGFRAGSGDAELLGERCSRWLPREPSGLALEGKTERGRGGTALAEAQPLASLSVIRTNLPLEGFSRTLSGVQGSREGWSLEIITVTLPAPLAGPEQGSQRWVVEYFSRTLTKSDYSYPRPCSLRSKILALWE